MNLENTFFINEKSEFVNLKDLDKDSFEFQRMTDYIQINLLDNDRIITGSFVVKMNRNFNIKINVPPYLFEELSYKFR